eukprot:1264533-Rhodomonas_salina.1
MACKFGTQALRHQRVLLANGKSSNGKNAVDNVPNAEFGTQHWPTNGLPTAPTPLSSDSAEV